MFKTVKALSICLCAIFTTLSACSDPTPAPIRIGINPWPGYEFLYLAQEKGFFRDAGISVQIVEFSTLDDGRRAFEKGLVDGIGGTLMEVILSAYHSKREPKIISIVDHSNGSDALITKTKIASIDQLKGSRIGVEVSSIGIYLLYRALEEHGLSLTDITIVPMSPLQQEKSFHADAIDAAATYPPVLSRLKRNKNTKTLFSSADIPNEIVDILMVDGATAKNRRSDLVKLLQVWQHTVDYASANMDEAYAIMAAREHITIDEMKQSIQGIKLLRLEQQQTLLKSQGFADTIQKVMKTITAINLIKSDVLIEPQSLIDSSVISSQ